MPASILEDASYLSPAGKVVCTVTFIAGLAGLMLWVRMAGSEVEKVRAKVLEERAEFITMSKPDEMALVLPPVKKPATAGELAVRQGTLTDLLTQLAQDAADSPIQEYKELAERADPIELIRFGVKEGTIHPLEAPLIIDEVNVLAKTAENPTPSTSPIATEPVPKP